MTSDDPNHCPSGWTEERCQACAKARADRKCENAANQCFYKFTVKKVNRDSLEVSYPPSVWEETKQSVKNTSEETSYRDRLKDVKFTIPMKATSGAEVNPSSELQNQQFTIPTRAASEAKVDKTYVFTRCPEPEFTLGSEIDPNVIGMPPGQKQSKR